MTDDRTDAELASAYLDGEATDSEIAHVEADPDLTARVAAFESLRERLAVGDPPAGSIDDHVAAALRTFDQLEQPARGAAKQTALSTAGVGSASEQPARGAAKQTALSTAGVGVDDLADRRKRRAYERIPLGAVAAVVVVLALVGAFTQIDLGGGDDDLATSADTVSDEVDDSGSDGAATAGGGGADDSLSGSAALPEAENFDATIEAPMSASIRRTFSDADELAGHARELLDQEQASATTTQSQDDAAPDSRSVDPCDVVSVAGADPESVLLVFPAVLAGQDVTALVSDTDGRRLQVIDDASCEIIHDRTI